MSKAAVVPEVKAKPAPKETLHPGAIRSTDTPKLDLFKNLYEKNEPYITTAAQHFSKKAKTENRTEPSPEELAFYRLADKKFDWNQDPEAGAAYAMTAFSILSNSFDPTHAPEFITEQDVLDIHQQVHKDQRKLGIRETPPNRRLKYKPEVLTPDQLAREAQEHLQADYLTMRAVMVPTEHKFFFEKGWLKDKMIQWSIRREAKAGHDRSWHQHLPFYNRFIVNKTHDFVSDAESQAKYNPEDPRSFLQLTHDLYKEDAYSIINPDKQKLYDAQETEAFKNLSPEDQKLFEKDSLDNLFTHLDEKGHLVETWDPDNIFNEIGGPAGWLPNTSELEAITAFYQIYPEFKQKLTTYIQRNTSARLANNPNEAQISVALSGLPPAELQNLFNGIKPGLHASLDNAPFMIQTDLAMKILDNKLEAATLPETAKTPEIEINLLDLSEKDFQKLTERELVSIIASEQMTVDELKQKMGNRKARVNQALKKFKPYDEDTGWELKDDVEDAQFDQDLTDIDIKDFSSEIDQFIQDYADSLPDDDPAVIAAYRSKVATDHEDIARQLLDPISGLPAAGLSDVYQKIMNEVKHGIATAKNPEAKIKKQLIETAKTDYQNTHIKQSELDDLGVLTTVTLAETGQFSEAEIDQFDQSTEIKDILTDDSGTFTNTVNPQKLADYLQRHPAPSLSLIASSGILDQVIGSIFSQFSQNQQSEIKKFLNIE